MRKFLLGGWFLLAVVTAVHAQDFTQTMTAEERAAAGLDKLSPAELAKLKAVVERYKAGEVAVVQQQAKAQVAAHEAKAAEAEKKAAVAEAKAKATETNEAEKKQTPGWVTALVTLSKMASKPEKAQALESRLVGDFEGWDSRTVFKLENGQIWQQDGGRAYNGDKLHAPAVKIYPGTNNAYFMAVDGVPVRVKVKPIKLE